GLDGGEADMNGPVDRRSGLCENARDAEGLIVMLQEGGRAEAMGDNDLVAGFVAECCCDIGPNHRVEQIAERAAGLEGERGSMPVMIELEVIGRGPHHAEAAMAVTERNGYDPIDLRQMRDILVGFPGHIVRGVSDAENRIEQKIEAAASRAYDEVGARN